MLKIFNLLIFIMISSLPNVHTQTKVNQIRTGEILSGSFRIAPRTEQYLLYTIRDGKKQPLSLLTRTIELKRMDGEEMLSITQRYESENGVDIDNSVVRRRTLEPIKYSSELSGSKHVERFDFTAQRVLGSITLESGDVKNFDIALEEPVFNSVIENEILQALPLKNGYAASVRLYNPGKQFAAATFRVLRSEEIKIGGMTLDTWVVAFEGAAVPTTIWIAKKMQEEIMRRAELKDGSEFWRVRLFSL